MHLFTYCTGMDYKCKKCTQEKKEKEPGYSTFYFRGIRRQKWSNFKLLLYFRNVASHPRSLKPSISENMDRSYEMLAQFLSRKSRVPKPEQQQRGVNVAFLDTTAATSAWSALRCPDHRKSLLRKLAATPTNNSATPLSLACTIANCDFVLPRFWYQSQRKQVSATSASSV